MQAKNNAMWFLSKSGYILSIIYGFVELRYCKYIKTRKICSKIYKM